jgi:hypothetical protein
MNYDKQLIIVMLTHPRENLISFGKNLFNKHPNLSELVEYEVATKTPTVVRSAASGPLTENSRIQIVGHGDLNGVSCAGRDGKKMAGFIAAKAAPGVQRIKRISLTVCYGAGNPTRHPHAANPHGSFAADLHRCLKEDYQVITEVTARAGTIIVTDRGRKETRVNFDGFGEKFQNKANNMKYIYSWNGGDQVIECKADYMEID